jgi:hypothetical protein
MTEVEILYMVALVVAVVGLLSTWLVTRFTKPPQGRMLSDDRMPDFYSTPADFSRCRNLVKAGPTPCWHPHCDCMTVDYAEPRPPLDSDEVLSRHIKMQKRFERPRLGADEILRRHLRNPKGNTPRVPRIKD